MKQIHDRQPVILDPTIYDAWLDPETPASAAKGLLLANLDGLLQFHRVSRTGPLGPYQTIRAGSFIAGSSISIQLECAPEGGQGSSC
jgi:hypothetical protein